MFFSKMNSTNSLSLRNMVSETEKDLHKGKLTFIRNWRIYIWNNYLREFSYGKKIYKMFCQELRDTTGRQF